VRLIPFLSLAAGIGFAAEPSSLFVGAEVCARCHEDTHKEWSGARHSKMLQPATPASVKGDFGKGRIVLRGGAYSLRATKDGFYITESVLSGKEQEHRVDYTLGSRRIQHYLTKLPDGRIIVLPPSWDVTRKEWFHNMDIVNPEETDGSLIQVWNKNCYSCHVSREEKNFNAAQNTYATRWQDFGTNCERCHGPGAEHVASHQPASTTAVKLVVPSKLNASRASMVCAQCHSLRNIVAEGFTAGSDYFDFYLPILEYGQKPGNDPSYWPDGRTRRFSNDALGLWQSECFLKGGATCVNCHTDVHDPEIEKNSALRPGANAICTGCHASIGQNIAAHSHHGADSAGSACVECHMPRTVFSIKAAIRDHSISIPIPENTSRFGIPNACNVCHQDRDANWTIAQMKDWYGDRSRQKLIGRASAFSLAHAGDRKAIGPLLGILGDVAEGAVVRANATGHLSRFSDDSRVLAALEGALHDQEPLVRAVAAQRIESKAAPAEVSNALVEALGDPSRSVRVGAVLSLVNLGAPRPEGEDGQKMDRAEQEYLARAAIQSDDASEQFNAGSLYLMSGNPRAAAGAFQTALRLDPKVPAAYGLAYAYAQAGRRDEAIRILQTIPFRDPYYVSAQRLLGALRRQKQ
jgi:hypothetical protein